MSTHNGFNINRPNPERAEALAQEAIEKAKNRDVAGAIGRIEEAIRLDAIGALSGYHELRAMFYSSIGRGAHERALVLYNLGYVLGSKGNYEDAQLAYKAAATLDPAFLWPRNNLAWMLATREQSTVSEGKEAVKHAREACDKSDWSCWAFIGTLAAGYAKTGGFVQAVGWQRASLQLVPDDQRPASEEMLRCFEAGIAYMDRGHPIAAGESAGDEIQELNEERLKDTMKELIAFRSTDIH